MAETYIMTPKLAETVLQSILDIRREVREKTVMQLEALNVGANMLERAVENGAGLEREAAIVRYHAANRGAYIFQDDRTRNALSAAIAQIRKYNNAQRTNADE